MAGTVPMIARAATDVVFGAATRHLIDTQLADTAGRGSVTSASTSTTITVGGDDLPVSSASMLLIA